MGEEGDSGFGGVGFRKTEGLDKAVGKGEATFDNEESAGDAGTEGVGWLRDDGLERGGKPGATMAEEEGLECPGKLVLDSWMDCREGLVGEIFR